MRLKVGDVVAISIGESEFGYGRVHLDSQLGIYRVVSSSKLNCSDVIQHDVIDIVGLGDNPSEGVSVIGEHRFDRERDAWGPLRQYGTGYMVYDCGDIRVPTSKAEKQLPRMHRLCWTELPNFIAQRVLGQTRHIPSTAQAIETPKENLSILADDVVYSVSCDYQELIADGRSRTKATQQILADYAVELTDIEDRTRVYLGIAVAQIENGRMLKTIASGVQEILAQAELPQSISAIFANNKDAKHSIENAIAKVLGR